MTDKLRDYFDEMVVYKDLKNNNFFSSLGLPAFLRDYLLKMFSDDFGNFDVDEVSAFVKKFMRELGRSVWRYVGVVQKGNQWNQNQGFYIYKRYCLREQMRKICFPQRS